MNPGSIHLPPASITFTSVGMSRPTPTAAIFPSSIRTVAPSMGSPAMGTTYPPTIAAVLSAMCAPGVCSVWTMRFAFKTAPQNTTWAGMLDVWRAADDIEVFESGWTFDHFYPIFGDSSGPCLEGWITLTALAQATRRIRLGTLVTGIHYRHPAVLANMAATLDNISDGRLELGIGAGWK